MPAAPLPPELQRFVAKPRHAVVGTVRDDGTPVTTPCWYGVDDAGRLILSMSHDSHRLRHLRSNPRVSLSILGDDWYSHVSVVGRAVETRSDDDLADILATLPNLTSISTCLVSDVLMDRLTLKFSPDGSLISGQNLRLRELEIGQKYEDDIWKDDGVNPEATHANFLDMAESRVSLPQMVDAFMATSTWPGPGTGRSTSASRTVELPGRWAASMVLLGRTSGVSRRA